MKFIKVIKSNQFTVKDLIEKLQQLDQNKVIQVHGNNHNSHTDPIIIELNSGEGYDSYYVIVNIGNTTFDTDKIKDFEAK